jgi:predicted dehydrogenase
MQIQKNRGEHRKLGVALVGVGEYVVDQVIPALQETQYCELKGLVSSEPEKLGPLKEQYQLPEENIYSYDRFDEISDNPGIDIVYIVLPNSMHVEYCIRAAKAGKHINCEKPMAVNRVECLDIIEAVEQAGVRFSMGYRLHFDPHHIEMMRLGQQELFGPVKRMILHNSMDIKDSSPWRLDKKLSGGGPLMNNGVYCVQAAIYLSGQFPTAVEARFAPITDRKRFKEVEEGIEWTFYFDNGLEAHCETSYTKDQNLMRVEAERGWFELSPAFAYDGLKGKSSEGEISFEPVNQQAAQMDDFAICILTDRETRVPPEMGLRDVVIMEAIYRAAKTGERIKLELQQYATSPEY